MLVASTPVTSSARTTGGQSAAVLVNAAGNVCMGRLALNLAVTAASGTTPTLDVSVQWSDDGITWAPAAPSADAFTQRTTTGAEARIFDVKGQWFRIVWAIGGTTPSFTFAVTAATL